MLKLYSSYRTHIIITPTPTIIPISLLPITCLLGELVGQGVISGLGELVDQGDISGLGELVDQGVISEVGKLVDQGVIS